MNHSRIRLATYAACALLLSACASGPSRPVTDAERDQSGQYAGTWNALFEAAPSRLFIHNWEVHCGKGQEFEARLVVEGGAANMLLFGKMHTTNVGKDGKFRFEVPTGGSVVGRGGSDVGDGSVTYIVTGNLAESEPRGRWTHGVKSMGNTGCNAPVRYTKQA